MDSLRSMAHVPENGAFGSSGIPESARIASVEEHWVTLNGIWWRCLRAGSGPALLLVHGLMGFSWSWRFNILELAKSFTVYAPDLAGCGFSQRSNSVAGSLESDAQGLIALMDHFGVERFHLLGTSRGGGVAVVLAALLAKRGELHRVSRMILSAAINPWSGFGRRRTRLFSTPLGQLYVIHATPRLPSVLRLYYRKLYGEPSRIAEGSIAGYAAGLLVPRSFHHLARVMTVWHSDLRQVEASLPLLQELPILLLWGSRDVAVVPSSAYELHDRLANSTVLMMDGVGHLPYEELPAEFNGVVCEFLLRQNPKTPLELPREADQANRRAPQAQATPGPTTAQRRSKTLSRR